jgi:transposase
VNPESDEANQWLSVIGRSLAFLCLTQADLRDKELATQGKFLETLGLSRKEAAALLGTSYASLTELIRQASKRKGGKRARAKKKA